MPGGGPPYLVLGISADGLCGAPGSPAPPAPGLRRVVSILRFRRLSTSAGVPEKLSKSGSRPWVPEPGFMDTMASLQFMGFRFESWRRTFRARACAGLYRERGRGDGRGKGGPSGIVLINCVLPSVCIDMVSRRGQGRWVALKQLSCTQRSLRPRKGRPRVPQPNRVS